MTNKKNSQLRIERNFLNLIESIYEKLTGNILLSANVIVTEKGAM